MTDPSPYPLVKERDTARDFLYVGCEGGHDMRHIGGRNAGCAPDCGCSIPVHTCSRCGDCDHAYPVDTCRH